jgi:hypothetical protein
MVVRPPSTRVLYRECNCTIRRQKANGLISTARGVEPVSKVSTLLLFQQGGRTYTLIKANRVDLLPVIDNHERQGEQA